MKWPSITRKAYEDAAEATQKLREISPSLSVDFGEALVAAFDAIGANPRQHARLETNRTDQEVRRVFIRRFKCLVIYKMIGDVPLVVAVQHASQEPSAWQREGAGE